MVISGSLTREYNFTADGVGLPTEEIAAKRSVMVMSSGGDGHSVFARSFMNAMEKTDKVRTGSDLFNEVRDGVSKISPQAPQYGAMLSAGHQRGGDVLFGSAQ